MTVASTTRKTALFAGDNATTDFPFTFKVFAAADLLVVRRTIATGVETELALTTHYTVTLNADQEANPGGVVALLAPLLDTYNLIISSKVSILQPAALANQGGFYPKVIMDALDRLTIISQQLKEEIDRCAKAPITYPEYAALLDDIAILATQTGDIETVADNIGDVVATGGSIANVNAVAADLTNIDTAVANLPALAGKVSTTLFDANTILKADADDTPEALTVAEQRIVGRKTGGNITALTGDEVFDMLPIPIRGYLAGLTLSNAADTDHDITIAVGTCRDSTNAYTLTLASAMTKRIDAGWAAGTNQGGLDTGSVGNSKYYAVYLIRKDSDGSIDALFSESYGAPAALPAGYTAYRRIGFVITDGSGNILNGRWDGDHFNLNTMISNRNYAQAGSTSRVLVTVSPPATTIGRFDVVHADGAGTGYGNVGAVHETDVTPSSNDNSHFTTINGSVNTLSKNIYVDTNRQIYFRASNSTNCSLGIHCLGWIDYRGKND